MYAEALKFVAKNVVRAIGSDTSKRNSESMFLRKRTNCSNCKSGTVPKTYLRLLLISGNFIFIRISSRQKLEVGSP